MNDEYVAPEFRALKCDKCDKKFHYHIVDQNTPCPDDMCRAAGGRLRLYNNFEQTYKTEKE